MKKTTMFAVLIAGLLLLPVIGMAQVTSSGTLTVNATVASSINLVFQSDAAGVALTSGAGTNAATLNFGTISAYGSLPGTITRTNGAGNFTVSTPVDVVVTAYNSGSTNYALTAQLGAADAVNGWSFGGTVITNSATTIAAGPFAYGSTAHAVALTVPTTSATGAISNTINLVATAN